MTTKNFKAAILATIATLTPVPYTCPVTGQKAYVVSEAIYAFNSQKSISVGEAEKN